MAQQSIAGSVSSHENEGATLGSIFKAIKHYMKFNRFYIVLVSVLTIQIGQLGNWLNYDPDNCIISLK